MATIRCVVRSCLYSCTSSTNSENRPAVTFHRFPKEPDLRSEWARILRLHPRQITDNSRACSLHFKPEELEERRKKKNFRLLPLEPISGDSSAAAAATEARTGESSAATSATEARTGESSAATSAMAACSTKRRRTINIPTGAILGTYENPIRLDNVDFDAHNRMGTQTSLKSEPADESDTFEDSTFQFEPSPSDMYRKKFYKNDNSQELKPHVLTRNDERQFLVSEGQLRLLLNRCPKCGRRCYHTAATSVGVDTTFSLDCSHCGDLIKWSSQPEIESTRLHYGNLVLTSAIILAGNTYQDAHDIAKNANLGIMCKKTFNRYARQLVYPAVDEYYDEKHTRLLTKVKSEQDHDEDRKLTLSMDARFSRPGFTATFGLVTAMCTDSHQILEHYIGSKTDGNVSSSKEIETTGTRVILKVLTTGTDNVAAAIGDESEITAEDSIGGADETPSSAMNAGEEEQAAAAADPSSAAAAVGDGESPSFDIPAPDSRPAILLRVGTLVTDENRSVAATVRREFPEITHESDPWHLKKSIMKRFAAAAKKASNASLKLWIRSIGNWLWTVLKSCDGCDEVLIEHWRSILYHIVDIHDWPDDPSFVHVHHCSHGDVSSIPTAYLDRSSSSYAAVANIVEDRSIQERLRRCSLFIQTSRSESFHGLLCKYVPKRLKFTRPAFEIRTKLSILDWNENSNRAAKTVHFHHPMAAGDWRAKLIYVDRGRRFADELMELIMDSAQHRWTSGAKVSYGQTIVTDERLVETYDELDDDVRYTLAGGLHRGDN